MGQRIDQFGQLNETPRAQHQSRESFSGSKIRKMILAAILAAAPVVGGCAEDETRLYDVTNDAADVTPQAPKGEIDPFFTGYEWVYDGKYPEPFTIEVYETAMPSNAVPDLGEEDKIYTEIVIPDADNIFKVFGPTSEDATWVKAKTFNESGEEIIIGPDPGPEGMKGLNYIPVGIMKENMPQ